MASETDFVSEFLKDADQNAFFMSLFVPADQRAHIQSLWAFAADIAMVRSRVSEPAPGEIRLQWWHDFLEGTQHGSALNNPLAAGLQAAIDRYDLPLGPLRRLVAARRFDLYDDPMPDVATFEGYAGEVRSILYQFTAMMLNGGNDADAADAAGHLGVAETYVSLMFAQRQSAQNGQIMLPWTVFAQAGVAEKTYFAQRADPAIIAAHQQNIDAAKLHLSAAKQALVPLKPQVKPAFATIALLEKDLAALTRFAELPFAPPPKSPSWRQLARMAWWNMVTSRQSTSSDAA